MKAGAIAVGSVSTAILRPNRCSAVEIAQARLPGDRIDSREIDREPAALARPGLPALAVAKWLPDVKPSRSRRARSCRTTPDRTPRRARPDTQPPVCGASGGKTARSSRTMAGSSTRIRVGASGGVREGRVSGMPGHPVRSFPCPSRDSSSKDCRSLVTQVGMNSASAR